MIKSGRDPAPQQKSPFERVGLWVVLLCAGLAFTVLAWAITLPDGTVN